MAGAIGCSRSSLIFGIKWAYRTARMIACRQLVDTAPKCTLAVRCRKHLEEPRHTLHGPARHTAPAKPFRMSMRIVVRFTPKATSTITIVESGGWSISKSGTKTKRMPITRLGIVANPRNIHEKQPDWNLKSRNCAECAIRKPIAFMALDTHDTRTRA
jgi:hypothetical protein